MPTIVKNRMANEPKNRAPAITNQRFGWEKCLWHAIAHERGKKSSALHCRIHARSLALCQFRNNERVICSTVTCANDHHHTHFVVAPTLIAKSHGWCILSISSLFDTLRIPNRHPQLKLCTVNSAHTKNAKHKKSRERNGRAKKNITEKIQKSAFEIGNCLFRTVRNHFIFFSLTSFSCALIHSIACILWIQLLSKCYRFFSARPLALCFVLFSLSQSVFILC